MEEKNKMLEESMVLKGVAWSIMQMSVPTITVVNDLLKPFGLVLINIKEQSEND